MKLKVSILSAFLAFTLLICSSGQDVTQPESPVLDYVTVDPATGVATLSWIPSVSTDVALYVVYTYNNSTAFAIDTLHDSHAVNYTDVYSQARFKSVNYVVAAMDSSKNISPLSNHLSTIYLTVATDSCNNKIDLAWTGGINERHPVTGYEIASSIDGSIPTTITTVEKDAQNYSLNGYITDKDYCFFVTAVGEGTPVSVSNRQCTHTGQQQAPSWIELTALLVGSSRISISGSYDAEGEIITFKADKKSLQTGIWSEVTTGTGGDGNVILYDNHADTTSISLYRISAINNCGTAVITSSPVRNMVLSSVRENKNIILRWNNPFPGGQANFTIWRNNGNGYESVAGGISDTVYSDDYSGYCYNVTGAVVYYRVSGVRVNAPAGTTECLSSVTSQHTIENIYVANAFTPNGDGKNDLFAPTLSFTPLSYDFMVLNRLGAVLFRSSVPGSGWDGMYNGALMPAGAYLWTLKVKAPSGKTENRSGTITILP